MKMARTRDTIYVAFFTNTAMFLHYSISLCREISSFLGIAV